MKEYILPLAERYSSSEMLSIFSPQKKFETWRTLWIFLAEAQKELGLDVITQEMIDEMKKFQNHIDWDLARKYEIQFKHDVMAHIHAFGDQAPIARKIIHLGATSAYVGDNTDLILIKEALKTTKIKLVNIIAELSKFCSKYKDLPILGYTHFQPAQLTTLGKRASLWLQSILFDLQELERMEDRIGFLGVKGTTGTQASFKELFDGDYEKVKQLDLLVMKKAGFKHKISVSGQTYDRKMDSLVLNVLSGIAQSAHKFTNDIRLLQHCKELEEPFEMHQIGSSAMAYKRNPIRSERVASLAKFVMSLSINPVFISSTQWLERTLDDSSNRRLSIPQSFLAIDAMLIILQNIISELKVYPKVIEGNIARELPFMITENVIMMAVKKGADRQEMHSIIRELSMQEVLRIKEEGLENKLIQHMGEDPRIPLNYEEIIKIAKPENFTGFASEQVEDFIKEDIVPIIEKYKNKISNKKVILQV